MFLVPFDLIRIVEGVHTAVTKRNKEWQHKLPVVVLKVEEILYSKAMSEVRFRFGFAFSTLESQLGLFIC